MCKITNSKKIIESKIERMNIQTKKIGKYKKQQKVVESRAWRGIFVAFSKLLLLIFLASSLIGVYTYINSEIQKTAKTITELEKEKKNLEREIENNQIKIASLKSWSHINKQITKFNMDLHLPKQKQKIHVALIETPVKASMRSIQVVSKIDKDNKKPTYTKKLSMN